MAEIEEQKQKVAAANAHLEDLEQQIAEQDAAETRQREENKQKPPMSQSSIHAPAKTVPLTPSANLDEFDIDDDWDEEDWEVHPLAANKPEPDAHLLFTALETLGRGEDPLTQGIEQTTNNLVRISYQHFPEGTEQVLNALNHINSGIDAVVEFIDDSTENRVSASWQQLDETTQARILGAGKVLSVLVPVARVKGLKELTACQHFGRNGAFRQAKRDAEIPVSQRPFSTRKVEMTDMNGHVVKDAGGKIIMTLEYYFKNTNGKTVVIQDHSAGHVFNQGGIGDQGAHFNVRPVENTRTGQVPGTKSHYPYKE